MDWASLGLGMAASAYGVWSLVQGLRARPARQALEEHWHEFPAAGGPTAPTSLPGIQYGMTRDHQGSRLILWGAFALALGLILLYVAFIA